MATAAMALAAITGIGACSSSPTTSSGPTTSSSPATSSPGTPASGQHLAASDFATALNRPGTIVLDVRTPAEYATGHLPQARNINFEGSDFATQIGALDKDAAYAVYCHSGNRSGQALEQMAAAGLAHAYDLSGGIAAWQGMGGAVVMGGP